MILDGLEMLNKVPSIPSIIIAFFLGHFSGLISIDEILMVRSEEICFDHYGCYNRSCFGLGSLLRYFCLHPEPPDVIDLKYLLFTCERPLNNQVLSFNSTVDEIKNLINFDPKNKTILIVHGFRSSFDESKWPGDLKDLVTTTSRCNKNVIGIDWSNGAGKDYRQAAADTILVGSMIAEFLRKLTKIWSITMDRIVCIGHSLGAHICGYVGAHFRKSKLRLIIGLDPAGPGFTDANEMSRLDPNDAELVLSIHTNGADLVLQGFGSILPMGHYSFYVNGGQAQPGCERMKGVATNIFTNTVFTAIKDAISCAHQRANQLIIYDESRFDDYQSMAYRCQNYTAYQLGRCSECRETFDCQRFGDWFDYWPQQWPPNTWKEPIKYFIETRDRIPYSFFFYRFEIVTDDGFKKLNSILHIRFTGSIRTSLSNWIEINRTFHPRTRITFLVRVRKSLGRIKMIAAKLNARNTSTNLIRIKKFRIGYMNGFDRSYRRSMSSQLLPRNSTEIIPNEYRNFEQNDDEKEDTREGGQESWDQFGVAFENENQMNEIR